MRLVLGADCDVGARGHGRLQSHAAEPARSATAAGTVTPAVMTSTPTYAEMVLLGIVACWALLGGALCSVVLAVVLHQPWLLVPMPATVALVITQLGRVRLLCLA
jgi:uncharacterized membrane protein